MADVLTPSERAAIAAYPEDRVQRIPLGQYGPAETIYAYDPEQEGKVAGGLVAVSGQASLSAKKGKQRQLRTNPAREEMLQRRAKVLALTLAGLTSNEIAAKLHCAVSTVGKDRAALAKSGQMARGVNRYARPGAVREGKA